jgi:hypothetical protein
MSVLYSVKFYCILTIFSLTLKLTNVVDWSWLWVLSPLWIPILYILLIIIFLLVYSYYQFKKAVYNEKNML